MNIAENPITFLRINIVRELEKAYIVKILRNKVKKHDKNSKEQKYGNEYRIYLNDARKK